MNRYLVILTFVALVFITGCETAYYVFDAPPPARNDEALKLLSSQGFTPGTFLFTGRNTDTSYKGEGFVAVDFNQYKAPVLKTEQDTIEYIASAMIASRLVEIRKEKEQVSFKQYCYINATVFDDYILRQKKKIQTDDSSSLSAEAIGDTLHVFSHTIKKDSIPTQLATKLKYRKTGPVYVTDMLFRQEDYFYDFLTVVDSSVYSVASEKDSVDKNNPHKTFYEIRKITATKEGITCVALPYSSPDSSPDSTDQLRKDSAFAALNLSVKNRHIVFQEASLSALFKSNVAEVKFELQKMKGFPGEGQSGSGQRYIIFAGIGVLLIAFFFLFLRKKAEN